MEKLVIIGGGGHAKVLINILKKSALFDIIGYVDFRDSGTLLGVKYLGNDEKLSDINLQGIKNAVLGVGQVSVSEIRFNIVQKVKKVGFTFPSIISKNAIINEEVLIEEGSQVLDGVVINPGVRIGKFSIINTNSTIEHDCKIGSYCHISPSAVLSGGVEVGDFSMVGANAVVVQCKKIYSRCLIGAGSVVTKDITEEGVYIGNPSKVLK
ncbi:MAG: acetyltransferase [Ignavibacteriaceae bacterium]|nr:acetyltransferase [Ignavibacteriaceae bacterium]